MIQVDKIDLINIGNNTITKKLNSEAWDLYSLFHVHNPKVEPEYLNEREFVEGLTFNGSIMLRNQDGLFTQTFQF